MPVHGPLDCPDRSQAEVGAGRAPPATPPPGCSLCDSTGWNAAPLPECPEGTSYRYVLQVARATGSEQNYHWVQAR